MRSIATDVSGLPALITIQKGLHTFRFTTWNKTITVDGIDYAPEPGAAITGIQFPSDGSATNADVIVMVQPSPSGLINPGDGARGALDDWPIEIDLVDPRDTSTVYATVIGTIGSVAENANGMATIAANGLLRLTQEAPICEHYEPTCAAMLGDDRCKMPICLERDIAEFDIGRGQAFVRGDNPTGLLQVGDAYGRVRIGSPASGNVEDYANLYYECITAGITHATTAPTYPGSVGSAVTDGTAQFVARRAWASYARGQATDEHTIQLTYLPDTRAADPTWYFYGGLFIRSGNLSAFPKYVIRVWDPDNLLITLALPIDPIDIPANTQFELHPGCNLTVNHCNSRFTNPSNPTGTNIENFRGFTFVPSPELALAPV